VNAYAAGLGTVACVAGVVVIVAAIILMRSGR
jgi:hypothetical protein